LLIAGAADDDAEEDISVGKGTDADLAPIALDYAQQEFHKNKKKAVKRAGNSLKKKDVLLENLTESSFLIDGHSSSSFPSSLDQRGT
jgi:hypothetical protein